MTEGKTETKPTKEKPNLLCNEPFKDPSEKNK